MKQFNELKLATIDVNIFTILYLQVGNVNTISFMRKLAKYIQELVYLTLHNFCLQAGTMYTRQSISILYATV